MVNTIVKQFAKHHSKGVREKLQTDERVLQANTRRLKRPSKKVRIYVLEPSDEEYLVSIGSIDKPKIESSAKLDLLRLQIRLAKDCKCITNQQYLVAQKQLQEIGRMLGGWIKSLNQSR